MIAALVISFLIGGAGYEAVALRYRVVPTLTDILRSHPTLTVGAIIGVLFAAGWVILHLTGLI